MWHDMSDSISKIEYPMLSDCKHQLVYDFDVFDEEEGLAQRGSFIIDPDGKIVVYEVNSSGVGRNADELFNSHFLYLSILKAYLLIHSLLELLV